MPRPSWWGWPVIYAISAVLGIRHAAWPSFGVVFVIIGLDQVFDVDPTLWLPLLLAPALVWRALRPVARRTPAAAALWALVIFAGLVIAGLGAPDEVRGYVVAVAFIGHGVWDVVHWLRGTLVVRSLAEFCAVLDLTLGVAMLVVL